MGGFQSPAPAGSPESARRLFAMAQPVAALSAAHLAAILFPATLRQLYIARDDDPARDGAWRA